MIDARKACIVAIILISLVTVSWFRSGHIIYFWDATVPLNPLKAFSSYSFTWSESTSLGESNILQVKMIPYISITLIFSYLGGNITLASVAVFSTILY